MGQQLKMNFEGNTPDGAIDGALSDTMKGASSDISFAERVARTCHEVNRAYCEGHGDFSQVPWDEAPKWVHDSAMQGVKFFHENPTAHPSDMHNSWMQQKLDDGWKHGEVKDPLKKTHPCITDYENLPYFQKVKDSLFLLTVKSFVTI